MDRIHKIRRTDFIKWGCFFLLLGFFFLLGRMILKYETLTWDGIVFRFFRRFTSPSVTLFFRLVTQFANVFVLLFLTFLIWILPSFRKYGPMVTWNLLLSSGANSILKLFYARSRPLDVAFIQETGYSFPSGHSMVAMAFYGLFIYLIFHSSLTKSYKILSILGLSLLILLIGISRIYLGVHYASDVVGGFFLSLGYLILFTHLGYVRKKRKKEEC